MSRLLRLRDDEWRRIEPLLPPQHRTGGRGAEKGGQQQNGRSRGTEYSRGSAMECGALLDALRVMELLDEQTHREGKELLVRVVAMLSKMC